MKSKNVHIEGAAKQKLPIRAYNFLLKKSGYPAVTPDRIYRAAKKRTGKSDPGADYNAEALDVLCRAIDQEARLHPFGRFMIREKLIGQMESRLWAEYWFKKYPEILERPLAPVVLITGLQRTGTTKLQRVLSKTEEVRELLSWEAMHPAPIRERDETKRRIKKTRINEKAVRYISPGFFSIHPIDHEAPEEDVLLLDIHFMSTSAEAIMHVPSFAEWMEATDQREAYQYETKLLKLLQWQRPGKIWLLKSPHHLEYLSEIEEVLHPRKYIWTHRDPLECVPSFLSMVYHARAMFSDKVSASEVADHWVRKNKRMIERAMAAAPGLGEKLIHLNYDQIIRDDFVLLQADFPLLHTQKAISSNKSSYRSNHSYRIQDFGLTANLVESEFESYLRFRATELS